MPGRGRDGSGKRLTGSIIAGLLIVPITAAAAVALVGALSQPETTAHQAVDPIVLSDADPVVLTDAAVDANVTASACGSDAMVLIERERDGSITDLEAAALDALRQICDEAGFSIAGPPVPAPIVDVVTVTQQQPPVAAPAGQYDDDHDYDDDDHDDDDHDDDDDHEDDDDDDHEDDDDDDHEDDD